MGNNFRTIFMFILFGALVGCSSRPVSNVTAPCSELTPDSHNYKLCLAENGHKQSQFDIGIEAYVYGEFDDAIKWLTLAQQDGMPQRSIDYERTDNFYLYPNQPGIKDAAIFLSQIYEKGLGVRQDKIKARQHHYFASTIKLEVVSINEAEYMNVQTSGQDDNEKTFIVRKRQDH